MNKTSLKDLKKALNHQRLKQASRPQTVNNDQSLTHQQAGISFDDETSKKPDLDQKSDNHTNQDVEINDNEFRSLFHDAVPLKSTNSLALESQHLASRDKANKSLNTLSPYFIDSNTDDYAIFNEDYTGYFKSGYNQNKVQRYLAKAGPKAFLSLDIHGLTQNQAVEYILMAIVEALNDGADCIKVIHGKGKHSINQQSILHPTTIETLAKHQQTIAAISANKNDGGLGATYVLLKAKYVKGA